MGPCRVLSQSVLFVIHRLILNAIFKHVMCDLVFRTWTNSTLDNLDHFSLLLLVNSDKK